MPLNPNGKIDKPALPFPDTAQAAPAEPRPTDASKGTPTEEAMRAIWGSILPNAPTPIPIDESFFDLGGHSILATRLIFEVRKAFVVNAPLGLVFDQPTLGGLAAAIDTLRNADLGFVAQSVPGPGETRRAGVEYGQDYVDLLPRLQESYSALPDGFGGGALTVFLTGATGFLGAFVLRDLLARGQRVRKVICLVRGASVEQGLSRLREGSTDRGAWDEGWVTDQRVEVVLGDLGLEMFGLGQDTWTRVASESDVILHNGALVRISLVFLFVPSLVLSGGHRRFIGCTHTKSCELRMSSRP